MHEPEIVKVGGEIRDCPFCGNAGLIFLSGCNGKKENGEPELIYNVQCSVCGMGYIGDGLPYEEALRVWNRRNGG